MARHQDSPCFGCKKRVLGCRAECSRWDDYRASLDEHNSKIRKNKQNHLGVIFPHVYDVPVVAKGGR